MALFLITLILVAFCLVGLGIRVLVKKNGQFSRKCASEEAGSVCRCKGESSSGCKGESSSGCKGESSSGGKTESVLRHEDCPMYELHHGNTATRMAKAVELAGEA